MMSRREPTSTRMTTAQMFQQYSHMQAELIDLHTSQFNKIEKRFERIDERIERIDERFGKILNILDDHTLVLRRVDTDVQHIKARLDEVEGKVDRIWDFLQLDKTRH